MDIILLTDIEKLGAKYDVVTVKNGFGRNYLIPQKMAIIANKTNIRNLDAMKQKESAKEAKIISDFQEIADRIKGAVLKIGAKTGTSEKIFGSVTNIQIAAALKEQLNIDVDRKLISIPEDVKVLGTYEAVLDLHTEVEARITFEVVTE